MIDASVIVSCYVVFDIVKNFKTLSSVNVDLNKGFDEIINSPIYKDFVISSDGKTRGIIVYIKSDKKLVELIQTKNDYLERRDKGQLTSKEKKAYMKAKYKRRRDEREKI